VAPHCHSRATSTTAPYPPPRAHHTVCTADQFSGLFAPTLVAVARSERRPAAAAAAAMDMEDFLSPLLPLTVPPHWAAWEEAEADNETTGDSWAATAAAATTTTTTPMERQRPWPLDERTVRLSELAATLDACLGGDRYRDYTLVYFRQGAPKELEVEAEAASPPLPCAHPSCSAVAAESQPGPTEAVDAPADDGQDAERWLTRSPPPPPTKRQRRVPRPPSPPPPPPPPPSSPSPHLPQPPAPTPLSQQQQQQRAVQRPTPLVVVAAPMATAESVQPATAAAADDDDDDKWIAIHRSARHRPSPTATVRCACGCCCSSCRGRRGARACCMRV